MSTVSRETVRSWVYFMQAEHGGPIKIGISVDPEERLAAIQTGSPYRLRILHTEPGGRSREAQFHRRWARHRLTGEWFEPGPDILAYIARAPRTRRGPRRAPAVGKVLAAIPIGAWRILAGMILMGTRRRRRRWRPAALGYVASGLSVLAWAGLSPPWSWVAIAAVITAAVISAGWKK